MNQKNQLLDNNSQYNIRIFKKNGQINTKRKGVNRFASYNIYHILIGINWLSFILFITTLFFLINSVFASIFFLLPKEEFGGSINDMHFHYWWQMFFFSAQTITTVGYGQIPPIGFYSNLIAAFEALVGLLFFALITGLLYGRFSKPTAKLFFSNNILVSESGKNSMYSIRIANAKLSQLIEANAQLIIGLDENINGKKERKLYYVNLINDSIAFLNSSWTISHVADKESPLYNLNLDDLKNKNAEFILLIKAIDDTYATQVNTRISYHYTDITWNANFKPISNFENETLITDVRKISDYSNIN